MRINARAIDIQMANKGMTLLRLSELSGVSRQGISLILTRGGGNPATIGKIAKALEIPVEQITNDRETREA